MGGTIPSEKPVYTAALSASVVTALSPSPPPTLQSILELKLVLGDWKHGLEQVVMATETKDTTRLLLKGP